MSERKLTNKQQAFINEYVKCWNASEAARRAGYSEKTARFIGAENLTKPNIAEEIQRRITEETMSADEVLHRLTRQARGTFGDVLKLAGSIPLIDWQRAFETGAIDNVKEVNFKDGSITVKLYDAQSALVQLGRAHGLFVDRTKNETYVDEIIDLLRQGKVTEDDVREAIGDKLADDLFKHVGKVAVGVSEAQGES